MRLLMVLEFDPGDDDPEFVPKVAKIVADAELPHLKSIHLAIDDLVPEVLGLFDK